MMRALLFLFLFKKILQKVWNFGYYFIYLPRLYHVRENKKSKNLKQNDMRKLAFIIVAALFATSLPSLAQGLNVVSFKLLETDLTANTRGTQKMDQNGETAALIKIVTPEQGFLFDGGSLGIVGTEQKPGEIWLYVPRRAQKLTISHQTFGVLRDYYYPISVQGGRTYEMLLDIGTGRYVTFLTSVPKSELTIDGEFAGQAPIYNRYMNYGRHKVQAVNDRYEGISEFVILASDSINKIVSVDMKDMSDHFGNVLLSVDNNAEIYFNGRMVGTGSWKTQLREGVYEVETRAPDCDPVKTSFTVVAQQDNEIKATPPTPHTGYLSIYTRPATATAVYNGSHPLTLQESNILPIGTYQVEISRRGYLSETHEYTVTRNETTTDTVTLKSITYVKPTTFYFGGAYTLRTLAGVSGIVGAVIYNNDLQLSYTLGLTKSQTAYWYNTNEGARYQSGVTYKMSSMAAKYGYQISLMNKFAITPQLGFSIDKLSATIEDGSVAYGDKATCTCITIGVKLLLAPFQHCYLFAAPELAIANKKGGDFERIAEATNVSAGGFTANIGVLINF